MKRSIFIVGLILLAVVPPAYGQAGCPPDGARRYGIESAVVTYAVTGRQQGSETVYFDRWGMREARFSDVTKPRLGRQHIMNLMDNGWFFTLDFDKKIGKKEKDPFLAQACAEAAGKDSLLSERLVLAIGGKKAGTAELLGRRCDVWQVERTGTTYWLWQGLVLKTIIQAGSDAVEITAERIDEGVFIPADTFTLPPGFTFIEGDLNEIVISLAPVPGIRG